MTPPTPERREEIYARFGRVVPGLTPDDTRTVLNYLCGADPETMNRALDYADRKRREREDETRVAGYAEGNLDRLFGCRQ